MRLPSPGRPPLPLRAAGALLLLAAVSAAQEQPPAEAPARPPEPPPTQQAPNQPPPNRPAPDELRVDRPATVNGEAITADEIIGEALLLSREFPDISTIELQRAARTMIAGQVLLAAEARRLGVTLPDRELDEYWQRATGRVPDYAALAAQAGISVERQTELARRTALAEIYVRHRVGLRAEYGRWIAPDPRLVRLVTVTPSQLRDAFQERRAQFDLPERVACELYFCEDAAAAESAREIIAAGGTPSGRPPVKRELPLNALDPGMSAELAGFLREAAIGSITTAPADQGVLVVVVKGRSPAEAARFETAQETLRLMIMNENLSRARRELIETLRRQASYWPTDLFDE